MKTFDGYKKQALTDVYALLAGGGHKPLSDFSMAHTHPYLPLNGGTVTGNIILKGGTSPDMTYAGNVHPYIRFDNSDSDQNVSLIFTDYDTYRGPAGIKLVGNQENEWFEAANIYATTFYGALSGNATTASKWVTARTLNLTGSITGSVSFDGSGNITLNTTYGSGNITNLDSRYLKKTGDTMSGTLSFSPTDTSDAAPKIYSTVSNRLTSLNFEVSDDEDDRFVFKINYWNDTNTTNRERFIINWNNVISKAPIIAPSFNGNATSATKLQTPRTIWGQSFDGTGDISGSIHIVSTGGSWNEGIRMHIAQNSWCGLVMCGSDNTGTSGTSAKTWSIHNNDGKFYIAQNGSNSFTNGISCVNGTWAILSSGNVGIGTTSPTTKLHVAGDIYTTTGFKKNGSSDSYVLLGGGGHKLESSLNVASASVASKVYGQVGDTGSHELVRCDMNNDQFRIIAGSNGNNNGWAEIATADDGSEPIYVRQYTGVFSSVERTLTLLDANGHTHFPSYINIGGNENNNSSPDRVWGSNGSDSYLRSYRTSALSVANADTVDGVHAHQLCRIYTFKVHNSIIKVGTLTSGQSGHVCKLRFNSGIGYNAGNQDKTMTVVIRASNGSANSNGFYFESHSESYRGGAFTTFYLHQTSKTQCELYMAAFNYSGQSTYEVSFSVGDSWTNEISGQDALPTSNIFTLPNYQIAYTDYNVASVTKLQTPRTIWGQSFDGTGNVSGSLSGVGHIQFSADNAYSIGTTTSEAAHTYTRQVWARHLNASRVYAGDTNLYIGYSNTAQVKFFSGTKQSGDGSNERMTILTNGNVGIGVTNPSSKLTVNGVGDDKLPVQLISASRDSTWVYNTSFLAPNLTSNHNNAIFIGKAHSTRNAFGLTHMNIGDGSSSNYAALEIWGVGNVLRWYYDRHSAFLHRTDFASLDSNVSYMSSALLIREHAYGGAQADSWANAPRLSWHWEGRVQTQIGLASNNELYLSKNNFNNAYKLVYETGTWGINISGNADTIDGAHLSDIKNWSDRTASAYWKVGWYKIASVQTGTNTEAFLTLDVNAAQSNGHATLFIRKRADSKPYFICTYNNNLNLADFRLYYNGMSMVLYARVPNDWNGKVFRIISEGREGVYDHIWTLYSNMSSTDPNAISAEGENPYINPTYSGRVDWSNSSDKATRLQTSRTLWGQAFDGTNNVDNTLRIRLTTGNYCEGIRIQTGDGTWATIILGATADSGTNTNAWSIHRKADNNFAISRNSSDGVNGLVMTSVGMGLGTTAPTHRLDVRGDTKITGSIRDLAIGGGIYWNPYVESTTDGSDVASITVVKSGVAGGTTLVLRLMNDANDTILFLTSTAAKLYHNSYPILTTLNTYVSNNKGYINNTEITLVNNADTVDGYHEYNFAHSWRTNGGLYTKFITITRGNEKGFIRLHCAVEDNSGIKGADYIVYWSYDATNENKSIAIKCLSSYGSNADTSVYAARKSGTLFDLLFKALSSGAFHVGFSVISYSSSCTIDNYNTVGYTEETKPQIAYTSSAMSLITDITGNATSAINSDTVDGYHANGLLTALSNSNNGISITVGGTTKSISNISVNYANYSGSTGKLTSLGNYAYNNLSTDIPTNAVSYKIITSGGTDLGDSQYNVLHIPWSSGDLGMYLLFGANNGRFGVKYKHSGIVREVLDSSNYTSYAIPKSASCNKNWSYSGQSGQPTWLWGSNDGTNCYVWNPSNFSVNYANSAGNADTLDGYHANAFATASHSHPYLPLSGGTMTGLIKGNNKGGSWILGRANAALYLPRTTTDDWHPVVGFKTKTGSWEFGSVGDDFAIFSWESDSNYSSGTNTNTRVNLRTISGTIALTSDIPTKSSWNYDDVYSKLGHTHDDRYYTESEVNTKLRAYLPLAGGTMNANARISFNDKGNLYIGTEDNSGYVYFQDMASQDGTSYWFISQEGDASFKGTVTATTFSGALSGNATTATTASKLGSSTVGSSIRHFYLNAGTATASTATVGGTAKPMYLKSGVMTAISVTVGSTDTPVYLNGGTITSCGKSFSSYLPLSGGTMTGDLYVQKTSDAASIWARYYNKTAIRMVATLSAVFIQGGNYAFTGNVPMYLSGPSGNNGSTLYLKFSDVNASGSLYATHFYENSDIRYKKILRNLSINFNIIANLPLFDFEWIENNAIGTGTSALAVQQILPNLVSGTDKLTLDYGVLGTIAGITACKELVTLKSELLQLKEKVKLLEDKLRKYENI